METTNISNHGRKFLTLFIRIEEFRSFAIINKVQWCSSKQNDHLQGNSLKYHTDVLIFQTQI